MQLTIVTASPPVISSSYHHSLLAFRNRSCSSRRQTRPKLLVASSQNQEDSAVAAEASAPPPPPPPPPPRPSPPPPSTGLIISSALDSPSPSLINHANIQKIFMREALRTPDHYGILGLTPLCSYEEVETAFRKRCETVLQQGLSEEEIRNRLRALKVSYDILSSEEERRIYDWSLYHSQSPGGAYVWPYEADITQRFSARGPEKEPKDEEGIRKVWYFFLGWFVLSCILNVLLR